MSETTVDEIMSMEEDAKRFAIIHFDNNIAERSVRPAVLQQKNSGETQSILMSIFRTIKRRGGHPVNTVVAALRQWCTTGILPELSDMLVSDPETQK